MNKFIMFIKKIAPTKRKLIQLYCALLFNANIKGFVSGNIYKGNTKKICVPGINCYSCPGAVGACPLGSLQGSFSADKSTIFYVGGILLLYCILFGRMICGWFCPFGFIQELVHKIPTPKIKKSPVTRIISYLKYVILVFFVFIVPITYAFRDTPLPTFCKYICPAGTLEGGIGLLANKVNSSYFSMLGPLFTWKFLLLVSIMVGSIFIFRLFCRFICPLGAIYGLFNKISFFGVKVEEPKCTHCNLCVNHCKLDVLHVGDQECISCGECINVCPTKAISWKGPTFLKNCGPDSTTNNSLSDSTENNSSNNTASKKRLITRIISTVLMLGILVGVVIYFWNDNDDVITPPQQNEQNDDETLVEGTEIGNLCYGEELNIIDSSGILSEKINPIKEKKLTIINFWGTWCTPCVNELPYFNQIASDYADSVSVIAIHTNAVSETAPEYIKNRYAESNITFACDLTEEGYYTKLGGRGAYPYTVIIDENGVIIKVFLKALEYDDLKEVVEAHLNGDSSNDNQTIEKGNSVGNICHEGELSIITSNGISDQKIDPTSTKKITIINFWGTWCTPCVNELPYFDKIAGNYSDSVSVIAIHTNMVSDTAPDYIKEHYPDSKITFACDTTDEGYYAKLGGRGTYPYTVILDENGVINKIFLQALKYEDLESVVQDLLKD